MASSNSVFELNKKIVDSIALAFCLAGLLFSTGCSKGILGRGPDADKVWICDETADNAMRRQDYEAGIFLHQRLLKNQPENALALYHLGYAYGQTGEHESEVSCYEKAITLGLKEDRIFFNLGMAYGELSEWKKSIPAFQSALTIDPDNADNHFGLALAYQGSFADQSAEEEFLKAIKINPEHLDAHLYLSMLYADHGDLQKARSQLRTILQVDPNHRIAREFLESIDRY